MADEEQTTPDGASETPEPKATPDGDAPTPESEADASPEDAVADEGASAAEDALDDAQAKLDETAEQTEQTPEPTEDEAAALAAVQAALAGLSGDGPPVAPPSAAAPAAASDAQAPAAAAAPDGAAPFDGPEFSRVPTPAHEAAIDLLGDVNLNVTIELGRTRMLVEDVLKLTDGAVVELDKLAGDPVDVYVNGRPVARGEVLVLNDTFCVRVNQILDAAAEIAAEKKRK